MRARARLQRPPDGAREQLSEVCGPILHRIAEMGDRRGLEVIQTQARSSGNGLFPDMKVRCMRCADKGT